MSYLDKYYLFIKSASIITLYKQELALKKWSEQLKYVEEEYMVR